MDQSKGQGQGQGQEVEIALQLIGGSIEFSTVVEEWLNKGLAAVSSKPPANNRAQELNSPQ
eukprot:1102177-Prorocentrum_minimum.AAC.1